MLFQRPSIRRSSFLSTEKSIRLLLIQMTIVGVVIFSNSGTFAQYGQNVSRHSVLSDGRGQYPPVRVAPNSSSVKVRPSYVGDNGVSPDSASRTAGASTTVVSDDGWIASSRSELGVPSQVGGAIPPTASSGQNRSNVSDTRNARQVNDVNSRQVVRNSTNEVPTTSRDAHVRAADSNDDVARNASEQRSSSLSSSQQRKNKTGAGNGSAYLSQRNGRYDFLHIIKLDDLQNIRNSNNSVVVAIPHTNFLFDDKSTSESISEGKTPNAAGTDGENLASSTVHISSDPAENVSTSYSNEQDSSKERSTRVVPDDEYVAFTLINLESDEIDLLSDSQNGKWDNFDLLNAALIAEGLTSRDSRAHYCSRFETLTSVLKSRTNGLNDQLMKTERVYDFLHSQALISKYDLNCSSVAASIDSGVFNCVSATVLFNCLASRVGLEVAALETTGHAKSRVKFSDSFLDVETTCSSWNRLPDKMRPYVRSKAKNVVQNTNMGVPASIDEPTTESVDSVSLENKSLSGESLMESEPRKETGKIEFKPVTFDGKRPRLDNAISSSREQEDVVASGLNTEEGSTTFGIDEEAPLGYSFTRTRRPMHEITEVELVATIYYNIGVEYYQNGEYEHAIASYIKAAQLAPKNLTILGNLKATLNNWAIEIATKEKRYDKAIQITELGQLLDPDFHEFKMNKPIFFHNWVEYLAKDNKWDEIKHVQEEYWKRYPKQ